MVELPELKGNPDWSRTSIGTQPGGKIILAGKEYFQNESGAHVRTSHGFARLTARRDIDPTFGVNGRQLVTFNSNVVESYREGKKVRQRIISSLGVVSEATKTAKDSSRSGMR